MQVFRSRCAILLLKSAFDFSGKIADRFKKNFQRSIFISKPVIDFRTKIRIRFSRKNRHPHFSDGSKKTWNRVIS